MTSALPSAAFPISAGNVGSVVVGTVARASAVSLTSTTTANVTSVALPVGNWWITAAVALVPAASTSLTVFNYGVATTSATLPSNTTTCLSVSGEILMPYATAANVVAADVSFAVPGYSVTLSAATTLYLVVNATFSVSTAKACGQIVALQFV